MLNTALSINDKPQNVTLNVAFLVVLIDIILNVLAPKKWVGIHKSSVDFYCFDRCALPEKVLELLREAFKAKAPCLSKCKN
jgi:hypothetical protein